MIYSNIFLHVKMQTSVYFFFLLHVFLSTNLPPHFPFLNYFISVHKYENKLSNQSINLIIKITTTKDDEIRHDILFLINEAKEMKVPSLNISAGVVVRGSTQFCLSHSCLVLYLHCVWMLCDLIRMIQVTSVNAKIQLQLRRFIFFQQGERERKLSLQQATYGSHINQTGACRSIVQIIIC